MLEKEDNAFIVCGLFFYYYTYLNGIATKQYKFDDETIYHTDTRSLEYLVKDDIEYFLIGNDGGVTLSFRSSPSGNFNFQILTVTVFILLNCLDWEYVMSIPINLQQVGRIIIFSHTIILIIGRRFIIARSIRVMHTMFSFIRQILKKHIFL